MTRRLRTLVVAIGVGAASALACAPAIAAQPSAGASTQARWVCVNLTGLGLGELCVNNPFPLGGG